MAIAAVAVLGEYALRSREASLSLDIQHIRRIPAIVNELQASGSPNVLFLGNSLTRHGVQADTVAESLRTAGAEPTHVYEIYPDDTTLTDWHYLYRRYLVERGVHPDVLVVGFVLAQMEDTQALHAERVGRYFSDLSAAPEMFREDFVSAGDRVGFLLARVSSLYANRERLRDRALHALIPGYAQTAQEVNFSAKRAAEAKAVRLGPKPAPTYKKLRRFLRMTQESGARTVVVAMPQPEPYEVSPGMVSAVESTGARFLDMRSLPGISDEDYLDGFHLAPTGARVYSEHLAKLLSRGTQAARR
ncbi:MAG: hypothetical protein R2762_18530 [Bryobacteraceae bacterium]